MALEDFNTLEDLVFSRSFRNWVLNENTPEADFWANWVAQNPDRQNLVNHAKAVIYALQLNLRPLSDESVDVEVGKVLEKLKSGRLSPVREIPVRPGILRVRPARAWTIAATLAGICILAWSLRLYLHRQQDNKAIGAFSESMAGNTVITANAQPLQNPPVHDPVMIRQDSTYYIFCTGRGISVWSSTDHHNWSPQPPVFNTPPAWTTTAIPGFAGHFWAPDISYHAGLYYLYYAVSAFGKNTSCIGVAVNKTLDPHSPDFKWTDKGKVLQSIPGRDRWNAIDPNLIIDDQGTPWLDFGSFWDGIKLTKLAPDLQTLADPQQWYTIASRHRTETIPDTAAGDAAIEAPFICKKDNYYYLFVSFDYCCRGEKSTYKIMVGRAEKVRGPYLDRDGTPMTLGGGSLVLEGDRNWNGVGHCAIVEFTDGDWLVFHGYDAGDKGRSKLRMERLTWPGGWPVVIRQ